jgi:8-oxo-dGTP pyrophosphatase MutT (NUDIX family)
MTQSPYQEPADELVDHVDTDGRVLGVVTRGEMRAATLRHRCTYVFVVRSSGDLVVHRRAEWKSIYPGFWDIAFGGICGAGEPWDRAAARELAEEAGIDDQPLIELGALRYDADDGHVVGRAYVVVTDDVVAPSDGEVVEVDQIPLAAVGQWIEGRQVCSDSATAALPLLVDWSDAVDFTIH